MPIPCLSASRACSKAFAKTTPCSAPPNATITAPREVVAELKSFSESAAQTAATPALGNLPLAVLSHDPDKPSADLPPDLAKPVNDAWEKMQEELSHLSTRGTQTIAKNSGHYIQLDRPEIVIDAVKTVLDQARNAPDQAHAPAATPTAKIKLIVGEERMGQQRKFFN